MYKKVILINLLFFTTTMLYAATYTWDGSSSNLWNTAANWDLNAVPPAGSDLVFPSGASNISTSNNIAAGRSFASITFASGASAYTLSGNAIVISGGSSAIAANNTSLTMTISLNITFSTAAPTISVASGGTLIMSGTIDNGGYLITHSCAGTSTLSGIISGSGGLTKSGSGTLTLTGNNSFTGNVNFPSGTDNSGAILASHNNALGTGTKDVNMPGQTTALQAIEISGNITIGSNITIKTSGRSAGNDFIRNVSGDNTLNGAVQVTEGGGSYYVECVSGTLTLAGTLSNQSSFTPRSFLFTNDGNFNITGNIIDGVNSLGIIKQGTGTLYISGTNTYTGITELRAGVLKLGSVSALGSVSGITEIETGAALDLNGMNYSTAEPLTLYGTGVSSGGALMNSGSAATYSGLITLASASSIIATSGDITISNTSTISGATFGLTLGGAYNGTIASIIGTTSGTVTKQDAGTWTLSGANTFSGTTTISAGTLVLQNQYASPSHVISSGSILELNRTADLQYSSSTTFTGSGTLRKTGAGNVEWGGAVGTFQLSSGALIDVQAGTITGGHTANEVWTNNYSDLNVASGAVFNSVEANVRVDEITGSGTIYTGYNGSGYVNFTFGVDNGSSDFTGLLRDNSFAANFVKSGTGTITLSGTNTYTGTTTVSAGILKLNNTAALGTNAAGTTVSSGAALDLNGITYATTEALIISGTGVSSGGALINTGSSASFAGTVTMAADATITTDNQITLSATISPSTYNLTKAGTNSLVFTSNTATVNDLNISAGTLSAGSSTINLYGNFTISGATFTCGTGTIAFKGTAAQTISAATFNNLTIDNSTSPATSAVTLLGHITVNGALTMTTGILNSSSYTITLGSTATISETNPSSTDPSSYVTGYVATTRDLIQNVANTFGGIGLSLTESTQATNSTLVTRRTGTASTGAGNSSILRYFDVSPTVNSALNATMIFSYIDDELNGQSEDSLKLYRSEDTGSTWTKKAATSVNSAANTLSFSGITAFSRWTGSNKVSNPLPVDFVSFTSTKGTEGTQLKWQTAQEINNDYFDIERSHDGINFEKITSIKGVGTTNSISNYSYLDKSTNQTLATYYRLKQVDFDKKTEYSNIVFVNGAEGHKELNLYPNPLEEGKPLYACLGDNDEGIIKVSVFDLTGKLIHGFLVDNVVANANIIIENENILLKKGIYIIEIKSIHNDYKQKLEVK